MQKLVKLSTSLLQKPKLKFYLLTGGKGGWGNVHLSLQQTRRREPPEGSLGKRENSRSSLALWQILGLLLSKCRKSSLLEYFTNARPKSLPIPLRQRFQILGFCVFQMKRHYHRRYSRDHRVHRVA